MYNKLPVKDRMDWLNTYKKTYPNGNYRDAINYYNNSLQEFGDGGKTKYKYPTSYDNQYNQQNDNTVQPLDVYGKNIEIQQSSKPRTLYEVLADNAKYKTEDANENYRLAKLKADRSKRISNSIEAQKENLLGNPDWREVLSRQTQATGDKLRISNEENIFDDYINPASWVGNMASSLGQAPKEAKESNSYLPYIKSIIEPLAMGVVGELLPKVKGAEKLEFSPVKLESVDKEFNNSLFKQSFKPTQLHKDMKEAALDYAKEATSKENFIRAEKLDAEYGTNYVQRLNEFKKELNKPENLWLTENDYMPFNIKLREDPNTGSLAVSKYNREGQLNKDMKDAGLNSYRNTIRNKEIEVNNNISTERIKPTIEHELKHSYLHFDDMLEHGKDLSRIIKPISEIGKKNPELLNELSEKTLKDRDISGYEYFKSPHEVDAYYLTNIKKDMVDKGIIDNVHQQIDKNKLENYYKNITNKGYKKLMDMVDNDKFINMFNKSLYGTTAIGTIKYNLDKNK